jgi:NTE family protein
MSEGAAMRRIFVLIAVLTITILGIAQQASENRSLVLNPRKEPARRPRIGVALEGGGALGLAHIGVLQWFEEHHIPVDYVAGTSMGGLIGGFYAAGTSPDELRKMIHGIEWNSFLSPSTDFEDLSFRRKEDIRASPNQLILGLKNGLSLPAGLNTGHRISLLIDHITLAYPSMRSFDELPVPFRCVATDLISGKQVVFDRGEISSALRSTMSIPGAFTPVYDKDKVFVDGGLVNNLPTDVVRQMGADIVIAVHLETKDPDAKELQSLFTVLERSVRVVIAENELRGMAHADAVVSVDLSNFTATDYEKNDPIMQKGYETANEKTKLLANFMLDAAGWQEYITDRDSRKKIITAIPQFIEVEGTHGEQKTSIEHYLSRFTGHPLDKDQIENALNALTGDGRYDAAGYRMTERNGVAGLAVEVREKTHAPPTVQPSLDVNGSQSGETNFTTGARLTFMDIAGYRSEWRTDVSIGNTNGVSSELYRPFHPTSRWFFAPHASASTSSFDMYFQNDPTAKYRVYRANIGADLGYGFSSFTELRIGYDGGYTNYKLRLGAPQFSAEKGAASGVHLHFLSDHTDDPVIPRRGFNIRTDFHWFDHAPGSVTPFPSLTASLGLFHPISESSSIFALSEGGSTLGQKNTGIPQFFLGGPGRLGAYGQNELAGNQYYLFRTGYLHDLVTLPSLIGGRIYAVGSVEMGKMYGVTRQSGYPIDVSAGILAQTIFGPIFIGGSMGDTGHQKWFFQLGRVF